MNTQKDIEIEGQVERITFSNPENGFTIAQLKVDGRLDPVTVVGNLMNPTPGEVLAVKGEWTKHPRFGLQFKVFEYHSKMPASVHGVEKYLGSGMIKGIGPKMAERIVRRFGENTLDVIENHTHRLSVIEGLGKKRIRMIKKAWDEQREIREVMVFLQSHSVSSAFAVKIYKTYGKDAIRIVEENPYRLAMDIHGIGFLSADKIASELGFDKHSGLRAQAGILYVLNRMADEGHVFYPYEKLIEKSNEMLDVEKEVIAQAIADLFLQKQIVIEDIGDAGELFEPNRKAVYLTRFYVCETGVARLFRRLTESVKSVALIDVDHALASVQKELQIILAEKQSQAVRQTMENRSVQVITGGPGVGKTTIINVLIKIFNRFGATVMLAAPTGRAAKRMSEATGKTAKTIHRLLEYSPQNGIFMKNDEKPLECDVLIIDEISMVDIVLMYHLLKAVPLNAILVLVGDVDQLPSVGPGNVLADIIFSQSVPVVRLNEIYRQKKESDIIIASHQVNNGILPRFDNDPDKTDIFFIEKEDPEEVLDVMLRLVTERIPERFGFHPISDIQVLTPMHKGTLGVANLNDQLQNILNPDSAGGIDRGKNQFRVSDKVMQIRNNYDKEVFNGDIGIVTKIDRDNQKLGVQFDGTPAHYEFSELDEITLAYAISIHKSQGSEYPAVVIPIVTQHYIMLQRNLIYTAITRGKKLVILAGTKKALGIAVQNEKTLNRFTRLSQRLSPTSSVG